MSDTLYPGLRPMSVMKPLEGKNSTIIEMKSGQLVLLGNFNYFDLDEHDRILISLITDAIIAHRLAKPPKDIPVVQEGPRFDLFHLKPDEAEEPTPEAKENV